MKREFSYNIIMIKIKNELNKFRLKEWRERWFKMKEKEV